MYPASAGGRIPAGIAPLCSSGSPEPERAGSGFVGFVASLPTTGAGNLRTLREAEQGNLRTCPIGGMWSDSKSKTHGEGQVLALREGIAAKHFSSPNTA